MATSRFPTTLLFSPEFVLTAGAILFRFPSGSLEVCILHHLKKNEWLLPKGRKDRGETLEASAIRETFEETGYPCRIMPGLKMWTRAPVAGADVKDVAALATDATEPFAVTMRSVGPLNMKFIWWYIAEATGAPKVEGTQMESEGFASEFLPVEEALAMLTFANDREVVEKAAHIVRASKERDGLRADLSSTLECAVP